MAYTKGLVSVIIPIYNTEQYLQRCLDSVCNQTLKNMEIICVNDGSPDNSEAICLEYAKKDSRVVYLKKENGGLSDARNFGFAKSKGEFIYFLDSDDSISEDYLEGFYESLKNNNADLSYNDNVINIYENKTKKASRKNFLRAGVYIATPRRFDKIRTTAWSKMYRREFIERAGFLFEKGLWVEDHLYQEMIKPIVKKIAISRTGAYLYRRTGSSFSNTVFSDKKRDKIDEVMVYSKEYDYYQKLGILNSLESFFWLLKIYCRSAEINKPLCLKSLKELFEKFDDEFLASRSPREIKFYEAIMQGRNEDLEKLYSSRETFRRIRILFR